mmetsp:Transcript_47791/g.126501  ORF Transcript_47791/g.126501 Transcript_47791/m.126501 type:complete len:559 (-) Transcript_47791:132-1808(-)|eukprot:CAMPEP_0194491028 /NCGR_PEP_ID=MMETSP0253-20130528/10047_1 /TAXON_ID=2966 /ORGANISM="Noctiluca scintillans" /LENGTH=558 /DNA_ID=CAMNT_0039331715 /DNA_START=21 /DNA_END=1697 /DNA_ORIENTATION=+
MVLGGRQTDVLSDTGSHAINSPSSLSRYSIPRSDVGAHGADTPVRASVRDMPSLPGHRAPESPAFSDSRAKCALRDLLDRSVASNGGTLRTPGGSEPADVEARLFAAAERVSANLAQMNSLGPSPASESRSCSAASGGSMCSFWKELPRLATQSTVLPSPSSSVCHHPCEDVQKLLSDVAKHEVAIADLRGSIHRDEVPLCELGKLQRDVGRHEAMLAEVQGLSCKVSRHDELLAKMGGDMAEPLSNARDMEPIVASWRKQFSSELREASADSAAALRQARGELEERLEKLRSEVSSAVASWGRSELEFQGVRGSLAEVLHSRKADIEFHFGDCQRRLQGELQESRQILRVELNKLVAESQDTLSKRIDDTQLQVDHSFADIRKNQTRLTSELMTGFRAAVDEEAAAVASLDEQLLLTDLRLGRRIDELALRQEIREEGKIPAGGSAAVRVDTAESQRRSTSVRSAASDVASTVATPRASSGRKGSLSPRGGPETPVVPRPSGYAQGGSVRSQGTAGVVQSGSAKRPPWHLVSLCRPTLGRKREEGAYATREPFGVVC